MKAPAKRKRTPVDVSDLDLAELELEALEKIPEDATEREADEAYTKALRKLIAKRRRAAG